MEEKQLTDKDRATAVLEYPVGEPEDGYDFKYWE